MLAKISHLTNLQAALIIAAVGLAVFCSGLTNPFMGDDISQIVNNAPVHSITNIRLFFEGSTFYNGQGIAPLSGGYYRPLMTTVFSLLYTMFGAHTWAFHLLQLLIGIGGAFLLYLFFRFSFNAVLALTLALLFLVHPLNSQVLFAIPNMQDALYFFFGAMGLWALVRFHSLRSLAFVAACFLLSLLSKETGILFIVMALLYLFWFDRRRLVPLVGIITVPLIIYAALRLHAIGIDANTHNSPIDGLSLGGRLLNAPAIVLFYFTRFIFPLKLASAYYWVYPAFDIRHVIIPFVIDGLLFAALTYVTIQTRRRIDSAMFMTYVFFGCWLVLGLALNLQIIPLDMTASETWFYFPMAGLLGMIGVVIVAFQVRIRPGWFVAAALVTFCLFGMRTAVRGRDWNNQYTLAYKDMAASPQNFMAERLIAQDLANKGDLENAKKYALQSTETFGGGVNFNTLGVILAAQQDYPAAQRAFLASLQAGGDRYVTYENLGRLTLVYGAPQANKQLLVQALGAFPQDYKLWLYLAVLESSKLHDSSAAEYALSQAQKYGDVSSELYRQIMDNDFSPGVIINVHPQ